MGVKLSQLVARDLAQDCEITGVTADSRKVKPGFLFAALPGAKVNGRDFAGKAVSAADAEASAALAAVVRDELVAAGFTPSTYAGRNGLIQRSDLGTLNRAEVPAVMIECGNMRNASDLAAMSSPSSQQRMAAAIAAATARWVTGSG